MTKFFEQIEILGELYQRYEAKGMEGLNNSEIELLVREGLIEMPENKNEVIIPDANITKSDYIQMPSGIYVAKERTLLGKNWFDCHKELLAQGLHMPTIPEFIEFLKYLRENPTSENKEIYNEITEQRNPWRSEWLDADFKMKGKELYINYNHVLDSNGNLVPKNSEKLEAYLMQDKTPGIDLINWINNSYNSQGLPIPNISKGNLYYWYPRMDNKSVARFIASSGRVYLTCYLNPSYSGVSLGVRCIAKAREPPIKNGGSI